ncbi:MAG: GNAT family N-acetyltransferase [Candidatus Izemoplasmataceae bacterium]
MFTFRKLGIITDNEIDLILNATKEQDDEKGYVPSYHFLIKRHNEKAVIGTIDLRIGFNENIHYGGNIGFSIYEEYRGNYYALKACLLLKDLAKAHHMATLRITCDKDNIASKKTIDAVGGTYLGDVDLPNYNTMYQEGLRVVSLYDWKL